MLHLLQAGQTILANGNVDETDLAALRRHLYTNGKIERREADFLVELHKRVKYTTPRFEKLFYRAIKDHMLTHVYIGAEEVAWLRRMLFADGKIKDEERRFLHDLKGEAKRGGREFEKLFAESTNEGPHQHAPGG